MQVAGDWKMYKDIFRFPQHNEARGCCWRCTATPVTFRDTTSTASWRHERLSHWDLIARMRQADLKISPLFSAPGFRTNACRLDWLHVADLGVSTDWLGQTLVYLLAFLPGANEAARINAMWLKIQAYYEYFPPSARLDEFNRNMLGMAKTWPKLKCHGKECRGMVPIVQALTTELLDNGDAYQHTVRQATNELTQCYHFAASKEPRASEELANHSRRFCTLWTSLERLHPERWRIKPKVHMLQELCEMEPGGRPTAHDTYRDEEFGGSVVALGRRRGGRTSPKSVGMQTLRKFCAKHRVPCL